MVTVTLWEFNRFFKPKNEAIGIVVMLVVSVMSYFGTRYLLSDSGTKAEISILSSASPALQEHLSAHYTLTQVPAEDKVAFIEQLTTKKEGVLLEEGPEAFVLHAYKSSRTIDRLKDHLTEYHQQAARQEIGLTPDKFATILQPAPITESFLYTDSQGGRKVLSLFFAGLMVMVVFLSFAYQFTAITGEKQLKITEQIVSAISPQIWMDGKIFGITLTGLASMLTYGVLSIIGGVLFFQLTGRPLALVFDYLHLPSIAVYLPFSLLGILLWNTILAAIASVITEPNSSGKGSLMMLPILFVMGSFLVAHEPDGGVARFLSWFPLTSATAMPMRWAITEVAIWEVAGAWLLLLFTFYWLRRLAAKVFRVSILLTGKEPTWTEVYKLTKQG